MAYVRKGNVYGVRWKPQSRHHKQKTFVPTYTSLRKSDLHRILLTYGRNDIAWAHAHYYRIYRHKYRGYTLYMGPPKISHGGIRHRPSLYAQRTKWMRTRVGMTAQDAAKNAEYIARIERKVQKEKQSGPAMVINREPPTFQPPGNTTGVYVGTLPKRKIATAVKEEQEEVKQKKRKKKEVQQSKTRVATDNYFSQKRASGDTPDITPKYFIIDDNKPVKWVYQAEYNPNTGLYSRPKRLNATQFRVLQASTGYKNPIKVPSKFIENMVKKR